MWKLKLPRLFLIPTILIMVVVQFSLSRQSSMAEQNKLKDQASLSEILKSTRLYCERVKQMALYYICKENITDIENFFESVTRSSGMQREKRIFNVRRAKRRTYSYDYQMIKKGDELSEQRIMLEESGTKRHRENADLSHLKYFNQYLIFGPVGFLSKYWQTHFTYSLIGEDRINDEPTIVIKAVPNEIRWDNSNIGRIWINKDFQILRVEWEPASIENYEDETLASKLGEFQKTVRWTVDYNVENNGVRFPGQQLIQEIFFRDTPSGIRQQAVKRETRFIYEDYKFFIVETNVDYKKKDE